MTGVAERNKWRFNNVNFIGSLQNRYW